MQAFSMVTSDRAKIPSNHGVDGCRENSHGRELCAKPIDSLS